MNGLCSFILLTLKDELEGYFSINDSLTINAMNQAIKLVVYRVLSINAKSVVGISRL